MPAMVVYRVLPALVLLASIACDPAEHDELDERGGKVETYEPMPPGKGDAEKAPLLCKELTFEGVQLFPADHSFVPGVGDLPWGPGACESRSGDADHDLVIDGQESCDHIAGIIGLAPGTTHFVTFEHEGALQCGCTCGPRSACDQPGAYTDYDAVGSGTYADPYQIYTAAQLADLKHAFGAPDSYVQCADINLASYYSPSKPYFTITYLQGDYDGQGHAIRGFTYDMAGPYLPLITHYNIGLFEQLAGRVSRLRMQDVYLFVPDSPRVIGGLAARIDGGEVWDVDVTGELKGPLAASDGVYVGGIAGAVFYDSRVTDIGVDVRLHGRRAGGVAAWTSDANNLDPYFAGIDAVVDIVANYGGGLVGSTRGRIRDAYVTGTVAAVDDGGGAAAYLNGSMQRVSADVAVTAKYVAGGLVARCAGCSLDDTRATGAVQAPNAGGLVGETSSPPSTVVDSYATGTVTGDGAGINVLGGLVGYVGPYSSVSRCYSAGDVTGSTPSGFVGGAIGYSSVVTIQSVFSTGAASGPNALPFGTFQVPASNRYNSDANPVVPNQGTPASAASGVFSDPNTNFGYNWPVGPGGWNFAPGQLPRLTDLP
jgi:hypothetical protein